MSIKMHVNMKLDQRMMMSQQLRQAITLLQYNTLDLKQLVQTYLERNPLLELDEELSENAANENEDQASYTDDNDKLHTTNLSADFSKRSQYFEDDSGLDNYAVPVTLRDYLIQQTLLCQFDEIEQDIAEKIIGAIDEDGYLTMSLDDIQKSAMKAGCNCDLEIAKKVLNHIQTFDPVGVGSRDIRECLLVQLECLTNHDKTWHLARTIISDHIEFFASNNVKKLVKNLDITPEEYTSAMELIRSLNPHPGVQFSTEINVNIEPELYVKKIRNKWQVFLSDSILTSVKINTYYQDLIKKNKKNGSYESLKHELEEARGLITGLKRRNETLYLVGSHIVELQSDFLEHGNTYMKPLNIADVSSALDIHESTVSRITTGKYINTPRGIFELKYFFPSHVSTNSGDACSAIAVKEHIKELIQHEAAGHVLSDEEIAVLLKEKGINISRRTVAKYRESMKILPSYQRNRMQVCEET